MKTIFDIDVENNLLIKTHYGPITVDDEIALLDKILADPRYRKGMNALCDFTEASIDWSLGDIDRFRTYVARIKDITGQCKWAIVSKGGITELTARVYILLHDTFVGTIDLKLFSNEKDAKVWINEVPVEQTT